MSSAWSVINPIGLGATGNVQRAEIFNGSQLRQQDQQIERMRKMQDDCRDLVRRLPKAEAADDIEFYVRNYLNVVANSHAGVAFSMLDEQQLARVLGILRHRLQEHAPF